MFYDSSPNASLEKTEKKKRGGVGVLGGRIMRRAHVLARCSLRNSAWHRRGNIALIDRISDLWQTAGGGRRGGESGTKGGGKEETHNLSGCQTEEKEEMERQGRRSAGSSGNDSEGVGEKKFCVLFSGGHRDNDSALRQEGPFAQGSRVS